MRWTWLLRHLLPVSFTFFVAWWLGSAPKPRATLTIPGFKHDDRQFLVSLVMSPNGRFLVSSRRATWYQGERPEETLQFWDLDREILCCSIAMDEGDFWRAGVFSPDDRWFAVPTARNTVRLWKPEAGKSEVEHVLRPKANRWSATSLAFTKAGRMISFRQDEGEASTYVAYDVETGEDVYRLPQGFVTPLVANRALHSWEGQLRLFCVEDGVDLSKPFLQNPYQCVIRNKNGDLESSFGMGHDFRGCTLDESVLFGSYRLGGMTSSTFYFIKDYRRNFTDDLDSEWWTTCLCPSWTGKFLIKTENFATQRLPEWLRKWFPKTSEKGLVLRDYATKQVILSIADGKTAAFSLDDRVIAVYVGQGKIHVWDLPPRTPWLSMMTAGTLAWAGAFLVIHWGVRRGRRGNQTPVAAKSD